MRKDGVLESVELALPVPVELQPHFDTTENHLLAAFEVNAQLHNVTIVYGKRSGLGTGRAQSYVVEKSARAAFDILDVPLAILTPELAVPPADDFAFEPNRCSGRSIMRNFWLRVSLGVAAHSYDLGAGGKGP